MPANPSGETDPSFISDGQITQYLNDIRGIYYPDWQSVPVNPEFETPVALALALEVVQADGVDKQTRIECLSDIYNHALEMKASHKGTRIVNAAAKIRKYLWIPRGGTTPN